MFTASKLSLFIKARSANGWRLRLKLAHRETPEPWSRFFISPSPGYVETEAGPVPLRDVEYLLIDPIEYRRRGRLVPDQRYDHSEDIQKQLGQIGLDYTIEDNCIRVSQD